MDAGGQLRTGVGTICVGIVLAMTGAAFDFSFRHWVSRRNWVPVNTPVSLSAGYISSSEFQINVQEEYDIEIQFRKALVYDGTCTASEVLRTRWKLHRGGLVVEQRNSVWWRNDHEIRGPNLGSVEMSDGQYRLELEVLPGADCLNASAPYLTVQANPQSYRAWYGVYPALASTAAVIGGAGLMLVIGSFVNSRRKHRDTYRIAPFLQTLWNFQSGQRAARLVSHTPFLSKQGPGANLPAIGFVVAVTSFIAMLCMWVPLSMTRASYGLNVYVLREPSRRMVVDPWIETLLVRMDAQGKVYFNSKEIPSEDLPQALNHWFRQGSSSVVYFEGDPNLIFARAARVMNTIERSGGKVILLTPKTRAESQARRR